MWTTLLVSSLFYVITGVFFALGFDLGASNNSLQALIQYGKPNWLCQLSVAFYAFFMLLPSVPVNSIVSYQNLVQNRVMGKRLSLLCAFVLPILCAIPLQTRNYLFQFLTWTSLIFSATTNFVIPCILYIKCAQFRKGFKDKVMTLHQLKLLGAIHSKSAEIEAFLSLSVQELAQTSTVGSALPVVVPPIIILTSEDSANAFDSQARMFGGSHEGLLGKTPALFEGSPERLPDKNPPLSKVRLKQPDYSGASLHPGGRAAQPMRPESSRDPMLIPGSSAPESEVEGLKMARSQSEGGGFIIRMDGRSDASPNAEPFTFVDPRVAGLPLEWEDDLPDPDHPVLDDGVDEYQLEVQSPTPLILPPPFLTAPIVQRRGSSTSSVSEISSGISLPREKLFKCPPFRALPVWFPFNSLSFCKFLLVFTSILSVVNIVVNGVLQ